MRIEIPSTRLIVLLLISSFLIGCKPTTNQRHSLRESDFKEPANARFLRTFGGAEKGYAGSVFSGSQGYAAFCTTQTIPDHPEKLLMIAFFSPPQAGHPIMQLQICCRTEQGTPDLIDPIVLSSLSAAQAEQVLVHGVPESLKIALAEAADVAGWDASNWKKIDCRFMYIDCNPYFDRP